MKLIEAKSQFIQAWGTLGSKWGINRTMAQLHALLMVSPDPMTADELMEELNISRGNVNMNVRELMDWGLVEKMHKPGDRKEYFWAKHPGAQRRLVFKRGHRLPNVDDRLLEKVLLVISIFGINGTNPQQLLLILFQRP